MTEDDANKRSSKIYGWTPEIFGASSFGPELLVAIKLEQLERGMWPDGVASKGLLDAMKLAAKIDVVTQKSKIRSAWIDADTDYARRARAMSGDWVVVLDDLSAMDAAILGEEQRSRVASRTSEERIPSTIVTNDSSDIIVACSAASIPRTAARVAPFYGPTTGPPPIDVPTSHFAVGIDCRPSHGADTEADAATWRTMIESIKPIQALKYALVGFRPRSISPGQHRALLGLARNVDMIINCDLHLIVQRKGIFTGLWNCAKFMGKVLGEDREICYPAIDITHKSLREIGARRAAKYYREWSDDVKRLSRVWLGVPPRTLHAECFRPFVRSRYWVEHCG